MFFKLTHSKETHIYNPKENPSLASLKNHVQNVFKNLPNTYQFSYFDEQNDQITLSNQEDFKIMRQTSNKVVKILIKESQLDFFDQTAKVELDDQIQKLAEQINPQEPQTKKQFVDLVEEHNVEQKIEEKPIQEIQNQSAIKEAQAQIQSKLKQLMPQLIEKVKQEIVKQSSIRNSVNNSKLEESSKKSQVKSQVPVQKPKIIHNVICEECGVKDFEGILYKCPICQNFNICEKCEVRSQHPHPFLKIKHPKQAEFFITHKISNQNENNFRSNECRFRIDKIPIVKDIKNTFEGFVENLSHGFQGHRMQRNPYQYNQEFRQFSHCNNNNFQYGQKVMNSVQKNDEKELQQNLKQIKIMQNAEYIQNLLGIDFNRCMKFSKKNSELTKEQLLELYFENPSQLV